MGVLTVAGALMQEKSMKLSENFGIGMQEEIQTEECKQKRAKRQSTRCSAHRSEVILIEVPVVDYLRTSDDWGTGCAFAGGAATTSRGLYHRQ